jgi:hypothetical protein
MGSKLKPPLFQAALQKTKFNAILLPVFPAGTYPAAFFLQSGPVNPGENWP